MNKAQLAAAILSEGHRADLTDETDGWIARIEEMIARDVRSWEQVTTVTLGDSDRPDVTLPIFTLPSDWLSERVLWVPIGDTTKSRALEKRSHVELRSIALEAPAAHYAIRNGTVEVRGDPGEEMEAEYFKRFAALSADEDTNALLTNHSELYISAGLYFLHRFQEDRETAQDHLSAYTYTRDQLNALAAHTMGGQTIAPAFNFTVRSAY